LDKPRTVELRNKTALITGASRGIGRAIALRLAEAGSHVIIHYNRDRKSAEDLARRIGNAASVVQADLRSGPPIEQLFEALHGTSLDILVNNAGVWFNTPLGSTPETDLSHMLDLNLKAVFLVTQAALPLLADGGRIINISSVSGRIAIAGGRSVYGATKAAVDSFTRSWALELAPRKILVNAIAPGYVETDMTAKHFADPQVKKRAVERHPLGKLGNSEEIADVVFFLCSDAARWITGQSINVSGGFVV
jgi:3-oxoacyl-[acyl-carrier protein] reductase